MTYLAYASIRQSILTWHCIDEKFQIQTLDKTKPLFPLGLGYAENVAHNCARHGTTALLVALDVATGEATTQCKTHHLHQGFLSFLS
jgi:hypothetical protein